MILFSVASARREIGLRRVLASKGCAAPIATTARDFGDPDGPAGPVWTLLANPAAPRRLPLDDLVAAIGGTDESGVPRSIIDLTVEEEAERQRQLDEDDRWDDRDYVRDRTADETMCGTVQSNADL